MEAQRAKDRFRPELQGLRAVAVGAVVIFHFWPERLTGGYVGVDVFFVLSGFLITSHIAREANTTDRLSLPAFWARRVRRLLPAAFLVLIASLIGVVLWVPRLRWPQFLHETVGSALYVENWVLAFNSQDYFASSNVPSPVQHYWSLSVEEQFYLVWPLLVVGCLWLHRRGRRGTRNGFLVAGMGIAFAASFVYSVVVTAHNQAYAYFVTPAHIWELAAGGLLALASPAIDRRLGGVPRLAAVLSGVGLAAILAAAMVYDGTTPFPGWRALLPVLGAAAVIVAGTPGVRWSPSRVLCWRPAMWLGDVSYSLYLWHWPIIVLAGYALGRELGRTDKLALLAASVIAAGLTKRYVEDPGRRAVFLARPRRAFALTAVASIALVSVSLAGQRHVERQADQLERAGEAAAQARLDAGDECFGAGAMRVAAGTCDGRTGPTLLPAPEAAHDDIEEMGSGCRVSQNTQKFLRCSIVEAPAGAPRMALVGDSHAEQWLPGVIAIAQARGWGLDAYLKGGCPVSTVMRTDDARKGNSTCTGWNDTLLEQLAEQRYDVVVTTAVSGKRYEAEPGRTGDESAVDGLVAQWGRIQDLGTTVVAIRDNPTPGFSATQCISESGSTRPPDEGPCSAPRADALLFDPQEAASERAGVPLIDLTDRFCDDERCHTVIGGVLVYRDDDHLTRTFVATLVPDLDAGLAPILDRTA